MRITFLLSSLWLSGGVLLVVDYANRLSQRGHAITIVLPAGATDMAVRNKLDAAVQIIESNRHLTKPSPPWQLALQVLALVQATPPTDIIIATHTPTTIPVVLLHLLQKAPHHAWLYMDFDEMFRQRALERFLLQRMPRYFEMIMPISQPLAVEVRDKTKAEIVVTGAGLARREHFAKSAHLNGTDRTVRLLYVGDSRPRKGLREFLAAATFVQQQLPNLELLIVSKEPLTVVTTVPYQLHIYPADEVLGALYRHCDVFISSSWGEGLGYPPLEAMACGTPVVLTDSVGVRDYAQHEVNCLVVPPRDPEALAAATLRIVHDPVLAQHLVVQGQETVRHYDWDVVIDRVESALLRLVKQH